MIFAEVFGWTAFAAGAVGVVLRLAWLARSRPNGQPTGGRHVRAEDAEPYGSIRETWSSVRFLLVGIAALACVLTGHSTAALWVGTPLTVVAAGPGVAAWLRSRAERKPGGADS